MIVGSIPTGGFSCHELKLFGDFEVGGFRALGCNLFRRLLMLLSCLVSRSTCGLVAMTSAPHVEGRQLDPGQVYNFQQNMICVLAKGHVFFQQPSFRVFWFYKARPGVFFDAYRWEDLDVGYFFKYYGAWLSLRLSTFGVKSRAPVSR